MSKQFKLTIYVTIYGDVMTAVYTCPSRKSAQEKFEKVKDCFDGIIKYTITEVWYE